ncbi:hypothetical protein GCM10010365_56490 [Streptomyces poonensis]|uniref:Uncharacterized protein n=1 Tax=Streptomyces poonensis TaxID=68255 RepID=A0A918Q1W1_9ACTN|nr:hypothetical protein GCM10010365_56490 [Streptomyces poonensis]
MAGTGTGTGTGTNLRVPVAPDNIEVRSRTSPGDLRCNQGARSLVLVSVTGTDDDPRTTRRITWGRTGAVGRQAQT